MGANLSIFSGVNYRSGFNVSGLFWAISAATISAKKKLLSIQQTKSAISIGDMFEMQMLMNNLSQICEMSTSIVSAANSATMSMARNVKG